MSNFTASTLRLAKGKRFLSHLLPGIALCFVSQIANAGQNGNPPIVPPDVITLGVQFDQDSLLEELMLSNFGEILNHDYDCADYVIRIPAGVAREAVLTTVLKILVFKQLLPPELG